MVQYLMSLKDKVIFITGSSRGIGREMALRFAREGAKVVVTGKTAKLHPKLKGTIYTVAEEIQKIGGEALALPLDVRDEKAINQAVEQVIEKWDRLDVLINNASAINLASTAETKMRRFDLMMSVNVRATFACSQACLPYLKQADNPHILTLSPPLTMDAKWFKAHLAYTMSKYGMSMCTLGMAEEFKEFGIAVNSLWPKTTIATAAIEAHFPDEILQASRTPAIVADAAHTIITSDSTTTTGNFFIDEDILRAQGMDNFDSYALNPQQPLFQDLFLD